MSVPAGKTIRAHGIVQGVGFRPFVHNLAVQHHLQGAVFNDSRGVCIRVFGDGPDLEAFLRDLQHTPPPLARIDGLTVEDLTGEAPPQFSILESPQGGERTVAVTPDACICKDCHRELLDPLDRRHRYPFINCTHCGPRYTLVQDVPYDRRHTTMAAFTMCPACQREYDDPQNRRYHAQPNCCPVCGPRLSLLNHDGFPVAGDGLAIALKRLEEGAILAIKGLGGFHLACNAKDPKAIERLRARKDRDEKPFAVMVRDLETAESLVRLPAYARALLTSPAAPIVIAPKADPDRLPSAVSPCTRYHGILLPYTPLHVLLLEGALDALIMTSANRSDEPIAMENEEALERLSDIADAFLMHNRPIHQRADDSVLMAGSEEPTMCRRSRGYVPSGFETGQPVDGIAGFGPFMKNTLALGRNTEIVVGPHVGELNNTRALDMFHEVYDHLQRILGVKVHTIACDMHPDYPTTQLAEASGLPVVTVQHHHAHLAALMAETRNYEKSIGIVFDGTGYGHDRTIWGGEVFVSDLNRCERYLHLDPVVLPGGDKAAREPWRMALAYCHKYDIPVPGHIRSDQTEAVWALLESNLPMHTTSAMGRLFDAASALAGVCQVSTYDAKAPMVLQGLIEPDEQSYPFTITNGTIIARDTLLALLEDHARGTAPGILAARFHNTVVAMVVGAAKSLRDRFGLNRVLLSGGVFMNSYLTQGSKSALEQEKFIPVLHKRLPPNDGAISAGQVLIASQQQSGSVPSHS